MCLFCGKPVLNLKILRKSSFHGTVLIERSLLVGLSKNSALYNGWCRTITVMWRIFPVGIFRQWVRFFPTYRVDFSDECWTFPTIFSDFSDKCFFISLSDFSVKGKTLTHMPVVLNAKVHYFIEVWPKMLSIVNIFCLSFHAVHNHAYI